MLYLGYAIRFVLSAVTGGVTNGVICVAEVLASCTSEYRPRMYISLYNGRHNIPDTAVCLWEFALARRGGERGRREILQ